jgi:xylulokinase
MFPKLYDAWEIVGRVTEQAALETGLAQGTPVLGGVDDASPVAIATGAVSEGQCYLSVGSAANVVVNAAGVISHPTTITYPHCIPGLHMLIAVLSSTGLSYKWMRNAFGQMEETMARTTGEDAYDYMNRAAALSPPGSNAVVFLPYLDGDYTPNNDANARGCFVGMGTRTTKNDMLRAVMEGVGFSILASILLIRELGGKLEEIILTGGIAKSSLWLQIIADITGLCISLPEETEGAPFGSAIVAGLGTGVFSDYDDAVARMVRIRRSVAVPDPALGGLYRELFAVYQGLYPKLADTYEKLAQIRQTYS